MRSPCLAATTVRSLLQSVAGTQHRPCTGACWQGPCGTKEMAHCRELHMVLYGTEAKSPHRTESTGRARIPLPPPARGTGRALAQDQPLCLEDFLAAEPDWLLPKL